MLTITPISFSGIKNLPQTRKIAINKVQKDTFERNITFKGKISFANWLESKGLEASDIKYFICDENIIGRGNHNTAFKIPECEEYCLRMLTSDIEQIKNADFSKIKIKDTQDKNLDVNIGQEVALAYIEREIFPIPYEIEILRKQTGESIGVQPPETIVTGDFTMVLRDGMLPYEDYSRKEKYARTIHKVAQLPIKSYEKLIQDFNKAQEKGYKFDYLNSNNLLVDEIYQTVNLIDMEKGAPTDLSGLLYSLTNSQYYRTFCDKDYNPVSEDMRNQATQDTVLIIRKFLQALKNQNIKLDLNEASFEAVNCLFAGYPCWLALNATSLGEVQEKLRKMGVAK